LNKQSRTADKGWPPAWGLSEVLTTPHSKKLPCYETFSVALGLTVPLVQVKQWKTDTEFGCMNGFGEENLREIDYLENPGVYGRIILKLTFRKWDGGLSWVEVAQNTDGWRALVNSVVNLRVPYTEGNSLSS